MKFSTKIISAAVLMASSSAALAAVTDSANIIINVTKDAYVVFDGTPNSTATPVLNAAGTVGADAQTLPGGTFGTTANITGNCLFKVESLNTTFNLETAVGVELYPAPYTVDWLGQNWNVASTSVSLPCTSPATTMDINMPAITTQVAAGTYSDTIIITLETP